MKRYISSAVKDLSNEDIYIRYTEAGSSVRGDVLAKLAEDTDERIRHKVATNPHTPIAVLEKLAKDPYTLVRRGVMINPSAPSKLVLDTAKSLSIYSGEAEIYLEIDIDSIEALGSDRTYSEVSSLVYEYLKDHGYSMYSDDIDFNGGNYYCRCGKFNSQEEANSVVYQLYEFIEDQSCEEIQILNFEAEMLLW